MGLNIQAGEADKPIRCPDLKLDWAAAYDAIKLVITKEDVNAGVATGYDMSPIIGMPYQAQLLTTPEMFPIEGEYRVQVVTYLADVPKRRSEMATLVVKGNE